MPIEKMKFGSLKEAKKYIADKLPGGQYTICMRENFAIIDERLAEERAKKAAENNEICSKTPYLRINGKFDCNHQDKTWDENVGCYVCDYCNEKC